LVWKLPKLPVQERPPVTGAARLVPQNRRPAQCDWYPGTETEDAAFTVF
jgi:hypothetical protein